VFPDSKGAALPLGRWAWGLFMASVKKSDPLVLVYVTAPTPRAAERLALAVIEEGLAACANVIGPVRSVFRWKGKIEREREAVLILKTRRSRIGALTRRIKALHTYTVPCVVALPILGGNEEFLAWIGAETRARPAARRRD
jgi:periplasmic divalent cation tolerance protein